MRQSFSVPYVLHVAVQSIVAADSSPGVAHGAFAQAPLFSRPVALKDAVECWKLILTRLGFSEAVLFDPMDLGTIYGVVRAPENEQGRALVEKEKHALASRQEAAFDRQS
jgi:hypothetical protein